MPMAVVTTIIASLFVSLTIVPFLGSRMLAEHHDPRGNIFLRGLKWLISKTYAKVLHVGLDHPKWTLFLTGILMVGVLSQAGKAGFSVFPASERPMLYIDVETAPGTNIERTNAIAVMVDSVLGTRLAPEMRNRLAWGDSLPPVSVYPGGGAPALVTWWATNVGKGNPRIYYNVIPRNENPELAQLFVQLQERTPPSVKRALIDELRGAFQSVPGAKITVKDFEQGPPIEAPVAIRVFGENLDTLRAVAARVEKTIAETEGTLYTSNPTKTIKTDLSIQINKDKAVTMGIPVAEVDRMVRLAIAGLNFGNFTAKQDGEEYNINLTLPKSGTYSDLNVLKNLYVNSLTGASIPLGQIAEVSFKASPNTITHYNKDRYAIVSAFVKSGYTALAVNQKIMAELSAMDFPRGYSYVVAGEIESSQRSFGGLGTIILITVFGLLAVLVLEFKTFKSTLIVLSVIPLGIIGAVLMLLATGYPFSFTVVVGLIALMGIEVKNSILLVDFTNQLRVDGRGLDDAIQEAGEIRFVPILLTSLTI